MMLYLVALLYYILKYVISYFNKFLWLYCKIETFYMLLSIMFK